MTKKYDEMTRAERVATVEITGLSFVEGAIIFEWSGAMGFGEYVIHNIPLETRETPWGTEEVSKYKLEADSEHMDSQDRKEFIRNLLMRMVDQIEVVN